MNRLRASLVADPYSGAATQPSWASPATLALSGGLMAPGPSTETDASTGDAWSDVATLYLPGQTPDIVATDRVVDDQGATWTVEGAPRVWPLGTVVNLRRSG